jgi:hypothetical protein
MTIGFATDLPMPGGQEIDEKQFSISITGSNQGDLPQSNDRSTSFLDVHKCKCEEV